MKTLFPAVTNALTEPSPCPNLVNWRRSGCCHTIMSFPWEALRMNSPHIARDETDPSWPVRMERDRYEEQVEGVLGRL